MLFVCVLLPFGQIKGVYKDKGPGGFYKGAFPRAVKSAINIALQFFLYDSLKRIANVAPDDLKVIVFVNTDSTECRRVFLIVHGEPSHEHRRSGA